MMTDLISAEILNMDVIKKRSVKIALRFTIYLLYLASKLKPSNIYGVRLIHRPVDTASNSI